MTITQVQSRGLKIIGSSLLLVLWLVCFILISNPTLANYEDQVGQTNVNKVDPLFEENIENFSQFKQELEQQKNSVVGSINNHEGMKFLPSSEKEAKLNADKLGKINASELESKGRAEFNKNPDLNDLFVDYSKPGMMAHKQDAAVIANGTDKLLGNLLGHLKELGIDCKSVKGNKVIEPEYYIEMEKNPTVRERKESNEQFSNDCEDQDTVYDQHFCEQLRNQYNCNDSLSLSCTIPGIEWGPWQDKQIRVPGGELVNYSKNVFFVYHPRDRCFEYRIKAHTTMGVTGQGPPQPPDPNVIVALREFLAAKHNAPTIDSIDTQMHASVEGELFSIDGWTHVGRVLGYKDYAWSTYVISYRYREGKQICQQWSEEWNEQCRLN